LSERLRRWSNKPDVVGSIPVTTKFFLISCDSNQVLSAFYFKIQKFVDGLFHWYEFYQQNQIRWHLLRDYRGMAKWFGAQCNQEVRFSSAVKCKKGPQAITSLLNQRRFFYIILLCFFAGHVVAPSPQMFTRWSTSRLNSATTSSSTSPCGSARSSFHYRQPYLGWRSQERLSKRTPSERLAAGLLTHQRHSTPPQQVG